jgi:hypothetical protein
VRQQRLPLVLLAVSAVLVLAACTAKPAETPAASSSAATTATAASIEPMSLDQKRSEVATSFLAEIPVPMGKVVRGEAQGPLAWDYEIVVAAPPAAVAEWYKTAFTGREWQIADQTEPTPGTLAITMVKNRAQMRVTISPEGSTSSRVQSVIGIGTPVLQTQ